MASKETRQLIIAMQKQVYEEKREEFLLFGNKSHYTTDQKNFAFKLILEYGIRAKSRILNLPRRTLQRW